MTEKTNLFAVQNGKRFPPTNNREMKIFVGIHILMGNLQYPRIKCYWQQNLRIPSIADSMPVNRFYQLRQNVHFVNVLEHTPENKDRMWKVRPLYNIIRKKASLLIWRDNFVSMSKWFLSKENSISNNICIKSKPTK